MVDLQEIKFQWRRVEIKNFLWPIEAIGKCNVMYLNH